MKKVIWIGVIVGVLLIGLGVVGMAYAQTQNPPQPQTPATGAYDQNYPGMMGRGGRGMMGGRFAQGQAGFGPMHEYMVAALAEKLGLTVDELNAKIANGERPYDIAVAQGLTTEEIQVIIEEAHDEALKAAVAAGVLTQEQADWMDSHMEQMWQNRANGSAWTPGGCGRAGGMRGAGGRWSNQP